MEWRVGEEILHKELGQCNNRLYCKYRRLNNIISHLFELIMSAEQSEYLGYIHSKKYKIRNNTAKGNLHV